MKYGLLLAAAGALISMAVALALFLESADNARALSASAANREQAYRLADELRQSSDDLTRMARSYAVTGDERYRRQFQEILDIRNGQAPRPLDYGLVYWDLVTADGVRPRASGEAVALQTLLEQAGFTRSEFERLRESENESNRLVELENRAFAAARQGDTAQAGQLLYSAGYHQGKARIMQPLAQAAAEVDERTAAEIARLEGRRDTLNTWLLVTIILAMALAAAAILLGFLSTRKPAAP